MMKRFVSIVLVVVMAWSGGLLGLAEAYAASQPVVIEKTDDYTIWQNADGTRTIRLECTAEELTDPAQPEAWVDQGEVWSNEGVVAQTTLHKAYDKNETLVTLSRGATSISFAPIMIEDTTPPAQMEVAESQQVGERQTASNVLRIGASPKRRPGHIEGRLHGQGVRKAQGEATSTASASSAVYEALFDENTSVELTALSGGVKENIVVGAYTGNHEFAYRVSLQGLTAKQNGQVILLSDGIGAAVAQIDAPNMRDASGAYSEDIAVSLESEGSGVYRLTYTPSDTWMQNAAYPVAIDPTATYFNDISTGIGDVYVSSANPSKHFDHTVPSGSSTQGNHALEGNNLYAGTNGGTTYYAYVLPALVGSELANDSATSPFNSINNVLIQSATWRFNVHEGGGGSNFEAHVITGDWSTSNVTYNNRPTYSSTLYSSASIGTSGWQTMDVTNVFSAWFNALDQKENKGFALISNNGWRRICSSDVLPRTDRMTFTATYYYGVTAPTVNVQSYGYGINSESGYVNLSWNSVAGASGYYLGIYKPDGSGYDYKYVGNVTSFTTKNQNLWPTAVQMAAGQYGIRWNGDGRELTNIPNLTNPDLYYRFRVVPANGSGQAAGNSNRDVSVLLPDTTPPNKPTTVSVSPASWSNAASMTVTWGGVIDLPTQTSSLGTGNIQYVINPTGSDPTTWTWQNTGINTANGTYTFSTAGLEDAQHVIYIRGVDSNGNYGVPQGAYFYVDKTPPTAPTIILLPTDWTKGNTASLSWSNIQDANNLLRVEYAVDTGSYLSTGHSEKAYSAYSMDISAVTDGTHTVSVRGVDVAGNEGAVSTANLKVDRSAPTVTSSILDPDWWTSLDTVQLQWTGANDPYSGIAAMEYSINGGGFTPLNIEVDGDIPIDVSALPDGQHTISLRLVDNLDNEQTIPHILYRDTTPPDLELISPMDGDVVTGVLECFGSVWDMSLKAWSVTAKGSSGKEITVNIGNAAKAGEQLGVFNTEDFADGEEITLTFFAEDHAGLTSTITGVVLKADHRTKPLTREVTITAPTQGEVVTTVHKDLTYTLDYSGGEQNSSVAIDGQPSGSAASQTYALYPILYPENSIHGLSVISKGNDNRLHYSQGMGTTLIISDILGDDSRLDSYSGLSLSTQGAELTAGTGSLTSKEFTAPRPVLAIRLHTVEQLAAGGSISYEYSVDNGGTWRSIRDGYDVYFDAPKTGVRIRASLSGVGTVLQGLDVLGVYEMVPVRFKAQLLKPVTSFTITNDATNTKAMPAVTTDSRTAFVTQRLYVDGGWNANSFVYDSLPFADGTAHSVSALGLDASGNLHGSGAVASIILRNTPNATGTYATGKLTLTKDTYALRLEALAMQGGAPVTTAKYEYSVNGQNWAAIPQSQYVLLPNATRQVYLRATLPTGVTLAALHLEGISLTGRSISTTLIQKPTHVQASNYGDYFVNEKLRRYEITWTDPNRDDITQGYQTTYLVYRNGKLIATVTDKTYADYDYEPEAEYHVAIRRTYDAPGDGLYHILQRTSAKVKAEYFYIFPDEIVPLGAGHTLEEFLQSEYLNDLYGGNYTFSTEMSPPSQELSLDQSLLGPTRFCATGFEPVNFNTGNFFLQMQDVYLPDLGSTGFDITRTYNTQSNEQDGPFGRKWGTEYAQHLRLYKDGSVAYRRTDGSEIIFYMQEDGTFESNSDSYEQLSFNDARTDYRITHTDGTVDVFGYGGLLKRIEQDGGQHVTEIERDEDGMITAIISPSQERLAVEMDASGHITSITMPGGLTTRYEYKGVDLVKVTNAAGGITKYVYDKDGRMTEWFDAEGVRQVLNKYDEQSRVVYQEDGTKGKYALEYLGDHTITTDAEGNVVTYFRDAMKRTTKIVDALGGETSYTYGENGEIVSESDPLGRVTTYEYNENGDLIKRVAPNGAAALWNYDDQHNLLSFTAQNGAITRFEYDKDGNLLKETAPDGGETTYVYDTKGRMVEKTDPLGNAIKNKYENGLLIQETDALGNVTTYAYDAHNRMVAMTDALGNMTQYAYDDMGNITAVSFADGTQEAYTYDAMRRKTSMTDPMGNVTKYAYDKLGNLIETTLPDGSKQTATYTKNYQLATETDALGAKTVYTYDANGYKLTETDPLGNVKTWTHDAMGWPTSMTLPTGAQETYKYDPATGLLIASTDATGLTNEFVYDISGNLLERTLPNGSVLKNVYDSMNRLVKQINSAGGETLIAYDANGNVTMTTDPMGAVTQFEYDALNRLVKTTDALGGVTTNEYDALDRIISTTDALGGKTSYIYDISGNLINVTDALGNKQTFTYDKNGDMTSITDPLGHTATLTYNKLGQATEMVQKNGGVIAATYDKAGRVVKETDAIGSATAYAYDKLGHVTTVTDALGQKAQFAYDVLGNLTQITAPGGGRTLYDYDAGGRLLSATDESGLVTTYTYNEYGQISSYKSNGNLTQLGYDTAGNISNVIDAEGREVRFAYDLNGKITEMIYPDGSADKTTYDALGRVVKETPRDGISTEYEYDILGRLIVSRSGDRETRFEYDALGQLVKQIMPDGGEQTYAYDELGNLVGETDAQGNETQYAYNPESWLEKITYANGTEQLLRYDLIGRTIAKVDGEGAEIQYAYDKVGRLAQITDALGNKTSYTYNSLDQIAQVKDALGHFIKYDYDERGNLAAETDALGNKTQYAYTPEGWLASITKPDGKVITYTYDKTGNLLGQDAAGEETIIQSYNEIGQLTVAVTKDGKIEYQYNEKGQLVSVTHPDGDTLSYTYDKYGRKETLTYPDGKIVRYEYDAMDRLVKVIGREGETISYTYDAAGRRTKTEGDGLTTTYAYDAVGNLTAQNTSGKAALELAYSYTPSGRMGSETRTENGVTVTSQYDYDALGQLTSFVKSDGYSETYSYDGVGNMLQKLVKQGDVSTKLTMTYNKGNQMTAMQSPTGKIAYQYDQNGNLTGKTLGKLQDSYTYDALDRLASFTGYDGFEQTYSYDAMGLRASMQQKGNDSRLTLEEMLKATQPDASQSEIQAEKDATAPDVDEWVKTSYIYDITLPYGQMLTEATGGVTTAYTYGLERIAAQMQTASGNLATQYVYDGRGSVAQTAASMPGVNKPEVSSFAYTAFGEQLGKKTTGFGYNAEWFDAATGMQNLRARQYEPDMNRFSQKDLLQGSVSTPLSLNRYLYVSNDPIQLIDPTGMSDAKIREYENTLKQLYKANGGRSTTITEYYEYLLRMERSGTAKVKELIKTAKGYADKKKLDKLQETVAELQNYTKYMDAATKKEYDDLVKTLNGVTANGTKKPTKNDWSKIQGICDNMYVFSGANSDDSITKQAQQGKEMLLRMEANKDQYPPAIQEMVTRYLNMLVGNDDKTKAKTLRDIKINDKNSKGALEIINLFLAEQSRYYAPNSSGNNPAKVPSFQNPLFSDIANGTAGNMKDFLNKFYGDHSTMTNDDWLELQKLLVYLESVGRLKYGEVGDSSHKYENGILTLDCWGALDFGLKMSTDGKEDNGLNLQKTSSMFDNYKKLGKVYTFPGYTGAIKDDKVKAGPSPLDPSKIAFVLIENNNNKPGYDHVYVVVANLPDKDNPNIVYAYGLLGYGGSTQSYDLTKFIQDNNKQVSQDGKDMPKIVYISK